MANKLTEMILLNTVILVSIVPPPLYGVGIAIAVEGTQIISGQYYAR